MMMMKLKDFIKNLPKIYHRIDSLIISTGEFADVLRLFETNWLNIAGKNNFKQFKDRPFCAAFSLAGATECAYKKTTQQTTIVPLSVQEFIDCGVDFQNRWKVSLNRTMPK